jgi:hypothetical protein
MAEDYQITLSRERNQMAEMEKYIEALEKNDMVICGLLEKSVKYLLSHLLATGVRDGDDLKIDRKLVALLVEIDGRTCILPNEIANILWSKVKLHA